ncbi:MAG: hypothetical protein WCF65_04135, partial [Parachlamydiaceae bacterium]
MMNDNKMIDSDWALNAWLTREKNRMSIKVDGIGNETVEITHLTQSLARRILYNIASLLHVKEYFNEYTKIEEKSVSEFIRAGNISSTQRELIKKTFKKILPIPSFQTRQNIPDESSRPTLEPERGRLLIPEVHVPLTNVEFETVQIIPDEITLPLNEVESTHLSPTDTIPPSSMLETNFEPTHIEPGRNNSLITPEPVAAPPEPTVVTSEVDVVTALDAIRKKIEMIKHKDESGAVTSLGRVFDTAHASLLRWIPRLKGWEEAASNYFTLDIPPLEGDNRDFSAIKAPRAEWNDLSLEQVIRSLVDEIAELKPHLTEVAQIHEIESSLQILDPIVSHIDDFNDYLLQCEKIDEDFVQLNEQAENLIRGKVDYSLGKFQDIVLRIKILNDCSQLFFTEEGDPVWSHRMAAKYRFQVDYATKQLEDFAEIFNEAVDLEIEECQGHLSTLESIIEDPAYAPIKYRYIVAHSIHARCLADSLFKLRGAMKSLKHLYQVGQSQDLPQPVIALVSKMIREEELLVQKMSALHPKKFPGRVASAKIDLDEIRSKRTPLTWKKRRALEKQRRLAVGDEYTPGTKRAMRLFFTYLNLWSHFSPLAARYMQPVGRLDLQYYMTKLAHLQKQGNQQEFDVALQAAKSRGVAGEGFLDAYANYLQLPPEERSIISVFYEPFHKMVVPSEGRSKVPEGESTQPVSQGMGSWLRSLLIPDGLADAKDFWTMMSVINRQYYPHIKDFVFDWMSTVFEQPSRPSPQDDSMGAGPEKLKLLCRQLYESAKNPALREQYEARLKSAQEIEGYGEFISEWSGYLQSTVIPRSGPLELIPLKTVSDGNFVLKQIDDKTDKILDSIVVAEDDVSREGPFFKLLEASAQQLSQHAAKCEELAQSPTIHSEKMRWLKQVDSCRREFHSEVQNAEILLSGVAQDVAATAAMEKASEEVSLAYLKSFVDSKPIPVSPLTYAQAFGQHYLYGLPTEGVNTFDVLNFRLEALKSRVESLKQTPHCTEGDLRVFCTEYLHNPAFAAKVKYHPVLPLLESLLKKSETARLLSRSFADDPANDFNSKLHRALNTLSENDSLFFADDRLGLVYEWTLQPSRVLSWYTLRVYSTNPAHGIQFYDTTQPKPAMQPYREIQDIAASDLNAQLWSTIKTELDTSTDAKNLYTMLLKQTKGKAPEKGLHGSRADTGGVYQTVEAFFSTELGPEKTAKHAAFETQLKLIQDAASNLQYSLNKFGSAQLEHSCREFAATLPTLHQHDVINTEELKFAVDSVEKFQNALAEIAEGSQQELAPSVLTLSPLSSENKPLTVSLNTHSVTVPKATPVQIIQAKKLIFFIDNGKVKSEVVKPASLAKCLRKAFLCGGLSQVVNALPLNDVSFWNAIPGEELQHIIDDLQDQLSRTDLKRSSPDTRDAYIKSQLIIEMLGSRYSLRTITNFYKYKIEDHKNMIGLSDDILQSYAENKWWSSRATPPSITETYAAIQQPDYRNFWDGTPESLGCQLDALLSILKIEGPSVTLHAIDALVERIPLNDLEFWQKVSTKDPNFLLEQFVELISVSNQAISQRRYSTLAQVFTRINPLEHLTRLKVIALTNSLIDSSNLINPRLSLFHESFMINEFAFNNRPFGADSVVLMKKIAEIEDYWKKFENIEKSNSDPSKIHFRYNNPNRMLFEDKELQETNGLELLKELLFEDKEIQQNEFLGTLQQSPWTVAWLIRVHGIALKSIQQGIQTSSDAISIHAEIPPVLLLANRIFMSGIAIEDNAGFPTKYFCSGRIDGQDTYLIFDVYSDYYLQDFLPDVTGSEIKFNPGQGTANLHPIREIFFKDEPIVFSNTARRVVADRSRENIDFALSRIHSNRISRLVKKAYPSESRESRRKVEELLSLRSFFKTQVQATLSYFTKNAHLLMDSEYRSLFSYLIFESTLLANELIMKSPADNVRFVTSFKTLCQEEIARAIEDKNLIAAAELLRILHQFRETTLYVNSLHPSCLPQEAIFPEGTRSQLEELLSAPDLSQIEQSALHHNLALSLSGKAHLKSEELAVLISFKITEKIANSKIDHWDSYEREHLSLLDKIHLFDLLHFHAEHIQAVVQGPGRDGLLNQIYHRVYGTSPSLSWKIKGNPIVYYNEEHDVEINVLDGTLKVAGRWVMCVDEEITKHPDFIAHFGDKNNAVGTRKVVDNVAMTYLVGPQGRQYRVMLSQSKDLVIESQFDGTWYQLDQDQSKPNLQSPIFSENTQIWGSSAPEETSPMPPSHILTDKRTGKALYAVVDQTLHLLDTSNKATPYVVTMPAKGSSLGMLLNQFEAPERTIILTHSETGQVDSIAFPRFGLKFQMREDDGDFRAMCEQFPEYHLATGQIVHELPSLTGHLLLANAHGEKRIVVPLPKQDISGPTMHFSLFEVDTASNIVVPHGNRDKLHLAYLYLTEGKASMSYGLLNSVVFETKPLDQASEAILVMIMNFKETNVRGSSQIPAIQLKAAAELLKNYSDRTKKRQHLDNPKKIINLYEYYLRKLDRMQPLTLSEDEERLMIRETAQFLNPLAYPAQHIILHRMNALAVPLTEDLSLMREFEATIYPQGGSNVLHFADLQEDVLISALEQKRARGDLFDEKYRFLQARKLESRSWEELRKFTYGLYGQEPGFFSRFYCKERLIVLIHNALITHAEKSSKEQQLRNLLLSAVALNPDWFPERLSAREGVDAKHWTQEYLVRPLQRCVLMHNELHPYFSGICQRNAVRLGTTLVTRLPIQRFDMRDLPSIEESPFPVTASELFIEGATSSKRLVQLEVFRS